MDHTSRRRCRQVAMVVGTLLLSCGAWAGKPENVTDAEMALLPPYCPDTYGFKYGDKYTNTSPNAPHWVGIMGDGFWALHHYCWALINLSRINRASVPPETQQRTRESALQDLYYVVDNTGPTFVILPEIYSKIGELQILLKKPLDAEVSYAKARALKPDYWPAYVQWAEFLGHHGQKAKARELAGEGLAYAPESRALQRVFRELGGDPATVKPRAPAASETTTDAQ